MNGDPRWHAALEAQWLSFEQAGWEYLLPDGRGRRWLCLDVLQGATACHVAGLCGSLQVVAPSPEEAAAIRQRLQLLGHGAVEVHEGYCPRVARDGRPFDGFILHDVRGALDDAAWRSWIAAGVAALGDGAFVYVAARNRLGYQRLRAPRDPSGARLAGILEALRGRPLTLHPYICDRDGRLLDVIPPTGYVSAKNPTRVGERVRRRLLGPRGAGTFASGFGVVSRARGGPPRLIDELVAEGIDRGLLSADATFRRYHVLRGGKAIISLGSPGRGFGRVIAIFARGSEAVARRDREFGMLKRLAELPASIAERVPRAFLRTEVAGTPAYLIEEFAGVTLDAPVAGLDVATREAIGFLCALHAGTRRDATIGPADLERLCEPSLRGAEERYPGLVDVIGRLRAHLRAALGGQRLPLVWMHGDFKVENVIVEPASCRLVGVIDWEHTEPEGLPFLDLWYLLLYNQTIRDGIDFFPAFDQLAETGGLSAAARETCARYGNDLGIAQGAMPGLLAAFVAHHIGRRVFYSAGDANRMARIRATLEGLMARRLP